MTGIVANQPQPAEPGSQLRLAFLPLKSANMVLPLDESSQLPQFLQVSSSTQTLSLQTRACDRTHW